MAQQPTQSSRQTPGGVAIVDIWTFTVDPVSSVGEQIDLTGFTVEATDGHIGKVDEATTQTGGSYLVVDTGPWIFGKKVMLPAGLVERIDPESKSVFVDASKDTIKNAPEFDEQTSRQDEGYRDRLGRHYGDRHPSTR
jgi:hypothetical protein